MKPLLISLLTLIICNSKVNAQVLIKIEDINNHIGDTVKICNKIYGGKYYNRLQGSPIYIYVGNDYPNNLLAIMITKNDRENFENSPEMMYACKDVCITGKLQLEKGKPILIVSKAEQIVIQK